MLMSCILLLYKADLNDLDIAAAYDFLKHFVNLFVSLFGDCEMAFDLGALPVIRAIKSENVYCQHNNETMLINK
jgi:hypothetical protein